MSVIFECKDLSKSYHGQRALNNVSITVESGRIVGLLGPNGSGKTTLLKIAGGLLTSNGATVLIDGKPIGPETKKIVSYLPDHNFLAQGNEKNRFLFAGP